MNRLTLLNAVVRLRAIFLFSVVMTTFYAARADEPKTLFSWDFNDAQSVKEWGSANTTRLEMRDDALAFRPTGWDPFVLSPHFQLKPKLGQYIEIRMRSTGYGKGEIFFASSDEGKYNGFSQQKSVSWSIVHDGEYRVYQIVPPWQAEPQIIKIRVDVGAPSQQDLDDGAACEIDYIRILDLDLDAARKTTRLDWSGDDLAALKSPASATESQWISPLEIVETQISGSFLRLEWEQHGDAPSNDPLTRASLRCLVNEGAGQIALEIPLFNVEASSTSGLFAKNVDLSALDSWGSSIYRWELVVPNYIELKRVALSKTPLGNGALESKPGRQVDVARIKNGQARVEYETTVRNCGGAALTNFKCALDNSNSDDISLQDVVLQRAVVDPFLGFNPSGSRLDVATVDDNVADKREWRSSESNAFPSELQLAPGEAFLVKATYLVKKSGAFRARLALSTDDAKIGLDSNLVVFPEIDLPQNVASAPTPKPIQSDYELGAYYFPGWSKRAGWKKIETAAPGRKPLLGYYDEGDPNVVDWQIKWAAENGIQFFFVDWYWYHGQVRLEHWVNAFQRAKHRSFLKWAVMWANHTGSGTHSTQDWIDVSKYWIDNYFKTPEYYRIDGKPVVVIWDQSIVDADMIAEAAKEGVELKRGEGCKRAFDVTRKMCEEAGFPGVYFIAIKWPEHATDEETIQRLADASFDATTIYHFMYPGKDLADQRVYPFDAVVDASRANWEAREATGVLPFLPNISTGWDSRPWHGFRSTVVCNRSVESFERLLGDFKEFADATGVKRAVLGPLNEWGEGSYIEPNVEFGFGMYEAIRRTLCKEPEEGFPDNYAPSEIGAGPYDIPETDVVLPEDRI